MVTMPVNPIVADTWEVRVHFSRSDGEEMVNTFYVDDNGDDLDAAQAADVSGVVTGAWTDNLIPVMSDSVTMDKIVVTDLDVANGAQFIFSPALAGALSDNALPNQTAGVVTWRTNTRGRSFRGRTYLGGFTEAGSVGSSPSGGVLTAMTDWAADMMGGMTALPHEMQVVSRYELNPTPPPSSIPRVTNLATDITSATVDLAWKTQRRRAIKG